ncbi:MAG TPA: hypothetical protein VMB71_02590, partial [Acetobacteraceae bacterium]|nr:hypothetical protein [Acetobacteraceae bacterium]
MNLVDILGPKPTGIAALFDKAMHNVAPVLAFARAVWPVARLPFLGIYAVTRYDDVRAILLDDPDFRVPYRDNLSIIMGDQEFFLGMDNTPEYRRDVAAMRAVVIAADLPRLAAATEAEAERLLDAANGCVDVVDFTRDVTFNVLCP